MRSGRDLARRIGKGTERIIFTIINKFASATKLPECHNASPNLIVLVDEGHRSQGGENHERMRKALPNASYVAFTGTPLLKDDKTANKFGRIVHAYTMKDAVADGTVTPLLYEERKPVLDINEAAIDNWFEKITVGLSEKQKSDLKEKYGKKGPVYGSANRIDLIAWDIAVHFKENFKDLDLGLKGQLATDSKLSAIRYKKALDATGLVSSAVIISSTDTREGHEDVDEAELPEVQQWWKDNVRGDPEEYERQTIEDFSTEGRPDILIVVDKLLTGFDEPRNAVLYIDKPLKEHNLIQAIARVNRLHEQKKYGLLIDYRGILRELDTALAEYQNLAERTQGGFDIDDIDQLYTNVSTEYKRLPGLHDALWAIFAEVKNRADIEQYRQILVPHLEAGEDGVPFDTHQKIREDFYEALTAFGMCLKVALASRSFYEDGSVGDARRYVLPRRYVSGEAHFYLGRRYKLIVVEARRTDSQVRLWRGRIEVILPVADPAAVRHRLKQWYREKSAAYFERKLPELVSRFDGIGTTTPTFRLLAMEKQWGSCSPSGRMSLNPSLIKAPVHCVEYVLIHELCHLIEHNHSKRFYSLLDRYCPDWREWKRELDSLAEQLLVM